MRVEYITHMGDDLMVVDAARVSFDKKSELESYEEIYPIGPPGGDYATGIQYRLSDKDTKLINYLAKNGHWSPFSHPQIQIRVTAPIFIANQLKRSVVGLSINEVSRRYVDDEPTFYIPEKWRGRPPGSIKQGSSDEEITELFYDFMGIVSDDDNVGECYEGMVAPVIVTDIPHEAYELYLKSTKGMYINLLKSGVAPEMARMVLPQAMNTSWIWTGSLLAFIRIYNQRIDSHSQLESQMIAKQLGEILEAHFPVSFKAWTEKMTWI